MLHKLIQAAIITCLLQLVLHLAPPKTDTTLNLKLSQVSSISVVDQH
jgi:hypothetical protein